MGLHLRTFEPFRFIERLIYGLLPKTWNHQVILYPCSFPTRATITLVNRIFMARPHSARHDRADRGQTRWDPPRRGNDATVDRGRLERPRHLHGPWWLVVSDDCQKHGKALIAISYFSMTGVLCHCPISRTGSNRASIASIDVAFTIKKLVCSSRFAYRALMVMP